MALFPRTKLTCFYCGKRQDKSKHEPTDAWKCRQCDAVNHLDKSGQIADPPAEENVTAPRFAQPVVHSNSSGQNLTSESLFCSTCLKNQHIYTEALANYLPAPEDPLYGQYEASLDEYKRALEERYPQVCVACEKQVIDRIQRTGYAARTDHLRRLMDKSRQYRAATTSGWKVYVLRLGFTAFYISILGQIAWSIPNAFLVDNDDTPSEVTSNKVAPSFMKCTMQIWQKGSSSIQCSSTVAPVGGISLFLGLLSLWWNPKWQHKLEGRLGRLRGLKDFYQLQAGALVFRFLAWVWLQSPQTSGLPLSTIRAFHVVLVLINISLVIALKLIVRVEATPVLGWNESVGPLVPESVRSQQLREKSFDFENKLIASFPISKLAPSYETPQAFSKIPTPPPEEVPDAMEWEPSHNIQPRIQHRTSTSHVSQRSPFHGRLPPAPSNRLLNPHPKASVLPERDSIGIPQGFFDRPAKRKGEGAAPQVVQGSFAEPSFFPPSDYNADTGLESVFGKVFSLRDQPTVAHEQPIAGDGASKNNGQEIAMLDVNNPPTLATPGNGNIDSIHLILATLLAFSFCFLVCISAFSSLAQEVELPKLKLGVTTLAGVAAICALRSRPSKTRDTLLYLTEFLTAVTIGLFTAFYQPSPTGKLHMIQAGFVSVMAWQGFYLGMSRETPTLSRRAARSGKNFVTPLPYLSSTQQHQNFREASSELQSGSISTSQQYDVNEQAPYYSEPNPSSTHIAPYSHISSLRPRSNSTASFDSSPDSDASTTITQTSGFTTPKFQPGKTTGVGWSPGTGLGSLNIHDGPPSGRLRSRNKRF